MILLQLFSLSQSLAIFEFENQPISAVQGYSFVFRKIGPLNVLAVLHEEYPLIGEKLFSNA